MKIITLICISLLMACTTQLEAQNPNFSEDIASIVYQNCSKCHHSGGIAPFPLISYQEVYQKRYMIQYAVNNGIMPPWPPDSTFQHYVHERFISQSDIAAINNWINTGAAQGDSTLAPNPPVFNDGAMLGTPDLKLTIPVYTSKATNHDDYVCFTLASGLMQDRIIRAVEVVPGDRSIVHHTLVFVDSTASFPTDTIGSDCGGPSSGALVTVYAPGGQATVFPNGNQVKMGIRMPAGSNIILSMHYPEGSAGKKDSTSVNIYFYPPGTQGIRKIVTKAILEDWSFCIAPNKIDTVTAMFPPVGTIQGNFSVLSVFPHMHLLGKKIESYGIDAQGDTIPFERINNWNFGWQDFYYFRHLQKVPAGTKLYAHAIYDNTTNNPFNPNNPPQQVCAGLSTTDEMFLVYLMYLPYQTGDELIDMDSLLSLPNGIPPSKTIPSAALHIYPNPVSQNLDIRFRMDHAGKVSLNLYTLNGQLVSRILNQNSGEGWQQIKWNFEDKNLHSGIYLLSGLLGNQAVNRKVVYIQK